MFLLWKVQFCPAVIYRKNCLISIVNVICRIIVQKSGRFFNPFWKQFITDWLSKHYFFLKNAVLFFEVSSHQLLLLKSFCPWFSTNCMTFFFNKLPPRKTFQSLRYLNHFTMHSSKSGIKPSSNLLCVSFFQLKKFLTFFFFFFVVCLLILLIKSAEIWISFVIYPFFYTFIYVLYHLHFFFPPGVLTYLTFNLMVTVFFSLDLSIFETRTSDSQTRFIN